MTQSINFTKDAIEKLTFKQKQYDIGDSKVAGLRLRVNPGKSKTFILYRKIEGKPCRITLGRFPDLTVEAARRMAAQLNGQIAEGRNPREEKSKQKGEHTFKSLFELYYSEHAIRSSRRHRENKAVLERHVFPTWAGLRLSSITQEKARRLHRSIADNCAVRFASKNGTLATGRGEATANKAMTLARAVFNFGIREGYYTGTNPCQGLKKFRQKGRDRFLSQEEIVRFLSAVEHEKRHLRDFFLLALFTGARKSNVLAMRYADIDFHLKRWRIAECEAKNGEVNIIALSRPALALLKWRHRANARSVNPSPFVFPGSGKSGHLASPKEAFARIKQRMGTADIRIHDLRRTLGSYMAIGGASLPIIGKALGHKSTGATAIYARLSHSPVLMAVDQAAQLMRRQPTRV